ncbi:uncharacterized protein LOC134180995 [Corticium candelabrum]|uniref:uncharacterized protein LOC134180995 n=1 Tax=Corticium candelabrum TaxID=121492 RepID=UPI002E273FC1|nr:uncharacterized protein LOC134180995 [Corticium candelabrum]
MDYQQSRQRFPYYNIQQHEYHPAYYMGQTRPFSPHWRGRGHYRPRGWSRGRGQYWHKDGRGRQGGNERRPYQGGDNIEQYYKPSMLEDPWKHLSTGTCEEKEEIRESHAAGRSELQQPELPSDSSQVEQTQETSLQ